MFKLAKVYNEGLGGQRDVGQATEYARKAADRGQKFAMTLLGWFYEAGIGVEPDVEEAERWYLKGMAAGDPEAYYFAAKLYLYLNKFKEGLDCVQRGVDVGSPDCHMLLGNMYTDGWGIEQDYKLALHWLNLAAQMGQPDALNNVGSCYREGIGTRVDEKAAAHWIKKSAEEGYIEAKYHYGLLLMEGFGVDQDVRAGIDYIQQSADADFAEAQHQIGCCSCREI